MLLKRAAIAALFFVQNFVPFLIENRLQELFVPLVMPKRKKIIPCLTEDRVNTQNPVTFLKRNTFSFGSVPQRQNTLAAVVKLPKSNRI